MIEFINVSKYYPNRNGRKYVFKNINFSIPENNNVGVLGLNGSGKSTLLRMIGGIDYPNEGEIKIKGSVSWPLGLTGGTQGSITGRENTEFVSRIYGDNKKSRAERIAYVRNFSELGDYFDLPVKNYSSGMRSRLLFGMCMAFHFDIFLIDEITAVGDIRFREKSFQVLKEKTKKSSYIMVSHNVNELIRDCDSLLILSNGKVRLFEDPQEGLKFYKGETVA